MYVKQNKFFYGYMTNVKLNLFAVSICYKITYNKLLPRKYKF